MDTIETRVQQVFADLTRYPIEILDLNADLEQDLGIDSVKRGEILAVLALEFNLPPMEELPAIEIWTIGSIARAMVEHGQGNGREQAAAHSFAALPLPPPFREVAAPPVKDGDNGVHHENGLDLGANGNGNMERRVLQMLAGAIQEALQGPASPLMNGSNVARPGAAPTRFLPASHRPFTGKIALVTGSGRGLGKVMANQLADLGAHVIINSFFSRERGEQVTAEINARGGNATHIWGSVANPKQLTQIFEEIDRLYGGLDFFVQNASNGLIAPIDQITDAHWEKAFRTNVVALHQGALLAAPLMKRRGGGKIVAISSPGAHSHIEHFGCIGPVKAAVESLVVYLSVELGPYNIQVNALSAGPLYGELMDTYPDSKRLVKHWEARAPDHRLGEEREVSNTVMFLLSDLADKTSGAVLLVDGASSRRL